MEVQQRYGDQVRFVGVPGLSNPEAMQRFVTETGTDGFPHIPDDGELWDRFGVIEQRTYVFIDGDGDGQTWTTGYGNLAEQVERLQAD